MHKLNISPLLNLGRFFSTQQLIYKRKIEKYNISLDIFVSDTSIDRNLHLPGKITFQLHKNPYFFLCDQISVFELLKNKDHLEGSGPYHHGGKRISALINDWENNIAYGKNPSQARPFAAGKCASFHAVCKQLANGSRGTVTGKVCNLYPHLCFETVFPALKLTQNCDIHHNIKTFFLKIGNLIINWLLLSDATCRTERPYSPFEKI